MRLLEMRDVQVGFSANELFTIDQLDIYQGEKIGLIGANGAGKSTLLRVMTGEQEALDGTVRRTGDWQFFRQFDTAYSAEMIVDAEIGIWGVSALWQRDPGTLSGGEKTRSRLARQFATPGDILLLDEPTSHLDMDGIRLLAAEMWALDSFILISHDRALLNEHCTRILDIREGKVIDYPGNYEAYVQWLEADLTRRETEYEQFQAEKKRLVALAEDYKKRANQASKKPKGMSSSEVKVRDFVSTHRSPGAVTKGLQSAAKHTEKRIEQLEHKERPVRQYTIRPDFSLTDPPQNKVIAESDNLAFGFPGADLLFDKARFQLKRNVKTALVGPNGSGKSLLCKLIAEGHEGIRSVPKARFGYFRQGLELVDSRLTILENMRLLSCQNEQVNRGVLARMGFFQERVNQKAKTLSGGELVKLSFAMLFVSGANVLILDEPTNYLDIPSLEAIEALLGDYEGTMLFVSHDRAFVAGLADEVWQITDLGIHVKMPRTVES